MKSDNSTFGPNAERPIILYKEDTGDYSRAANKSYRAICKGQMQSICGKYRVTVPINLFLLSIFLEDLSGEILFKISANWEQWGPWTGCSAFCGNGESRRERECPNRKRCFPGERIETRPCPTPCREGAGRVSRDDNQNSISFKFLSS